VLAWESEYGGRGYLRFAELQFSVPGPAGDIDVVILRAGPSRVTVRLSGAGEPPVQLADQIARRVHGLLVVYCQAPAVDFLLGYERTVDDDGELAQDAWGSPLGCSISEAAVIVPFEHQTDMQSAELADLVQVLKTGRAIRPNLLDDIQHSLTRAEGDVEAFLANYAILDSLRGGKKAVDAYIRSREPGVELVQDSRKNTVTIYTLMRNAKGHPSGMPPAVVTTRIRHLLPALRGHVRAALIEAAM